MGVQCGILDETLRTINRFWKAFGWRFTNVETHILGDFYFTTLKTCEDKSTT